MAALRPLPFTFWSLTEATREASYIASTGGYIERTEGEGEGARTVRESIQDWDFSRYLANPVVFWNHESNTIPLGLTTLLEPSLDGLKVTIQFTDEDTNPWAEAVWRATIKGLLRSLSVGFDPKEVLSEEIIDGVLHRRLKAELLEISVAPLPADPGALSLGLAPVPQDAAQSRKLDSSDEAPAEIRLDEELRCDSSRLGQVEVTGSGAARIPATFMRTGVLTYRLPDGRVRRELRHPDDVFSAETLASLRSAPVTRGHPYAHGGLVNPDNWRELSRGHVEAAERQDEHIGGTVIVSDSMTLDEVDQGELVEISSGYRCQQDNTPGVWEGQAYDSRGLNIRFNHIALLPAGRGRAGNSVGLRLDALSVEETMALISIDGTSVEANSPAHVQLLQQKLDAAQARLDAADEAEKRSKAQAEPPKEEEPKGEERAAEPEEPKDEDKELVRSVRKRARLLSKLKRLLGDGDDEDDEKLDGLSDRELHLMAIAKVSPDLKLDDKSDAYVEARFDMLSESTRLDASSPMGSVLTAVGRVATKPTTDPVTDARARMIARNRGQQVA